MLLRVTLGNEIAMTLHPDIVLITGAAARIGRALALDLAARGWQIGVHFNTSAAGAAETLASIKAMGGRAVALQADLADVNAAQGLIARCTEAIGPPTCLINNASCFNNDVFGRMTALDWQTHMDVNLRAPVFLAQAFAAALPDGKTGNIINIIDQRVLRPSPEFFSYTASKAALWAVTRTMAQALAPRIRVNAIAPGPVLQSIHQKPEDFEREWRSTILQRGVEVKEIAEAVRFILATPCMTGQMIALDGGQHLVWR